MDFDARLARAMHHLSEFADVSFASAIATKKELRVRELYRLPVREPIVALYDGSVRGSATRGYALTTQHFCWKNAAHHPHVVPWSSLKARPLARHKTEVSVLGAPVTCSREDLAIATAALLDELAEAPRSAPLTSREGLLDAIWGQFGVLEELFVAPRIPAHKERNVRAIHRLAADEQVLALFDNTVFGNAKLGVVFTDRRVGWSASSAQQLGWDALDHARITDDGDGTLTIHDSSVLFLLSDRARVARDMAGLLRALAGAHRGIYR